MGDDAEDAVAGHGGSARETAPNKAEAAAARQEQK
jgi:hypothetical protein